MANFGHFQRFSWKVEKSRFPQNGKIQGVSTLKFFLVESLDIFMFRLNIKLHTSVPRFLKKFFSLIFCFNLPNFTTLSGCLLKNLTFVQKLVSILVKIVYSFSKKINELKSETNNQWIWSFLKAASLTPILP